VCWPCNQNYWWLIFPEKPLTHRLGDHGHVNVSGRSICRQSFAILSGMLQVTRLFGMPYDERLTGANIDVVIVFGFAPLLFP
jgi:hypothetical protein